jgi:hypothetical protein
MADDTAKFAEDTLDNSIEQNVYNTMGNTHSLGSGIRSDKVKESGDMNVDTFVDPELLAYEYPSYNPDSERGRSDNRIWDDAYGGNIVSWLEWGQDGITPYEGRHFVEKAQKEINKKVKSELLKGLRSRGYKIGYAKLNE